MPSVSKPRTLRKEIPSEGDGTTQLGFRFHARALAALGRDLVTDDVVAVIELVKNAYDALATHVEVRIRPEGTAEAAPYIEVSDDGHGMDYATIRDVWCVIATPHKQESPVSRIGPRSRHVTGEKGLGRLSAARLGSRLDVTTKSRDSGVLRFSIDWERLLKADDLDDVVFNVSRLRSDDFDREHGTHIQIGGLASHWNKDKIDDLRKNLARTWPGNRAWKRLGTCLNDALCLCAARPRRPIRGLFPGHRSLTAPGGRSDASGGSRTRRVPPRIAPSCQPEVVHASAVIRQRYQGPFALHLLKTPQQKLPEAHRLLHDPEHRLHRLLAQTVMRPGAPAVPSSPAST